jgi:hypothetical protein
MTFINIFKNNPLIYISVSFIIGLMFGGTEISIIIPLFITALGIGLLFIKRDIYFISGILFCTSSFGWQMMFHEISEMNSKRSNANELHETTISFSSEVWKYNQRKRDLNIKFH